MARFEISAELRDTNQPISLSPEIFYWNNESEVNNEIECAPQIIASKIRTLIEKELSLESLNPTQKVKNIKAWIILDDGQEIPIPDDIIKRV